MYRSVITGCGSYLPERVIANEELSAADVVISPDISELKSTSFDSRNLAIIEGEKAGLAAVPAIKQKIEDYYAAHGGNVAPEQSDQVR